MSDLVAFFEEYILIRAEEKKRDEEDNNKLLELSRQLADPKENLVEKFIDDAEYRRKVIRILSRFPIHLVSGFISLLDKCIDETWKRSKPRRRIRRIQSKSINHP